MWFRAKTVDISIYDSEQTLWTYSGKASFSVYAEKSVQTKLLTQAVVHIAATCRREMLSWEGLSRVIWLCFTVFTNMTFKQHITFWNLGLCLVKNTVTASMPCYFHVRDMGSCHLSVFAFLKDTATGILKWVKLLLTWLLLFNFINSSFSISRKSVS